MLSPLDSLSIAAAVAGLIDFGVTLTVQAREIYKGAHAGEGTSKSIESLRISVGDFQTTAEGISKKIAAHQAANDAEIKLLGAAKACGDTAKQLQKISDGLVLDKKGNLLKAYRIAWKQKEKTAEIDILRRRLDMQWSLLQTHLILSMKEEQATSSDVWASLQQLDAKLDTCATAILRQQRKTIVSTVSRNGPSAATETTKTLSALMDDVRKVERQHAVLQSLWFPSMAYRHEQIKKAHDKTFDWTFDRDTSPPHHFCRWLRESYGLYWVSGKAGSGKSTLLKSIASDPRTVKALRTWSGKRKLIIASYYFYHNGRDMQKSQKGLMQSLLFKILQQSPELVDNVCDNVLKSDASFNAAHYWTLAELDQCLERLEQLPSQTGDRDRCFCFFIDGLDEYAGESEHERELYESPHTQGIPKVVERIKRLAAPQHIKVCTSSRPWNAFVEGFGAAEAAGYRLELHKHTAADIAKVVRGIFGSKMAIRSNPSQEDDMRRLTEEIMSKADGVFLWVILVCQELSAGLTNGDSLKALQERLREIPPGLKQYFDDIFQKIPSYPKSYRVATARIFRLCVHANGPIPALMFTVFDRENLENYALDFHYRPEFADWNVEEKAAVEKIQKQINGRCLDLVEIRNDMSTGTELAHVDFLHRTVKEYLQEQEISPMLVQRSGQFEPLRVLLYGHLYLLQQTLLRDPGCREETTLHITDLVRDIVYYAGSLEDSSEASAARALQHMDHLMVRYLGARDPLSSARWIEAVLALPGNAVIAVSHRDLLSLAIEHALAHTVRILLRELPPEARHRPPGPRSRPYLDSGLRRDGRQLSAWTQFQAHFDTVRILLESDCSPNISIHEDTVRSVWEAFLAWIHDGDFDRAADPVALRRHVRDLCKLLVQHGAANVLRVRLHDGRKGTVALEQALGKCCTPDEIAEILAEMESLKSGRGSASWPWNSWKWLLGR